MTNLRDKYEVVIGLEVHAQLKTKSKIFAPDGTEFGHEQNTENIKKALDESMADCYFADVRRYLCDLCGIYRGLLGKTCCFNAGCTC